MNDRTFNSPSGQDWLLYAILELSAVPDDAAIAGDRFESRLTGVLRPLALLADFASRVLASIRESVAHISSDVQSTRVLIYTSTTQPASAPTWGFFRIERNEKMQVAPASGLRTLAFYLYVESGIMPR